MGPLPVTGCEGATKVKNTMEEFVSFATEMKGDVLELLSAQPGKDKLWDWEYHANPTKRDAPGGVVIRNIDGRVVGFNGVMPAGAIVDGLVVDGSWTIDARIEEEYRGRDCGKYLYARVENAAPLMLAYGISERLVCTLHEAWLVVRPRRAGDTYFIRTAPRA